MSVEPRPLPEAESVEVDQSGGFNWALVGLLIAVAALLALVLFLRRQKVHTVPVQVEPMSPAALPVAEPVAPESEPAPPPAPPSPANGDGLVHARVPQSGFVTTNLAAKRRVQEAAPPVQPKRVIRPPAVTTRISFDGF
ncbi:MAG: hypothetical protein JY451_03365 [Erythrobacter sp.]|nr:MAG: hypothetical protein JY451_03365 [Erythrobacter sp.]